MEKTLEGRIRKDGSFLQPTRLPKPFPTYNTRIDSGNSSSTSLEPQQQEDPTTSSGAGSTPSNGSPTGEAHTNTASYIQSNQVDITQKEKLGFGDMVFT